MVKKILIAVLLLAIVGGAIGYRMYNKQAPKAEDAKGIAVNAEILSQEFNANEQAANTKYLNKVVEVSGTINETDKNQDGGLMVILQTGDPMTGIQCTMRDKGVTATKGQKVTILGFCAGNGITGVTLTDCVLK